MKAAIVLNCDFNREISEEYIFCADGGYKYLLSKRLKPFCVVGDFDSTEVPQGILHFQVPQRKDFTDGEYAVRLAIEKGFDDLSIYGAYGGRIDHVLYNLNLLAIAKSLGAKAKIMGDGFDGYLIDDKIALKTEIGDIISIVPFGDEVHIMSSEGLEYEIKNLPLTKRQTKGVSNVATKKEVSIKVKRGECLLFHIFRKEV